MEKYIDIITRILSIILIISAGVFLFLWRDADSQLESARTNLENSRATVERLRTRNTELVSLSESATERVSELEDELTRVRAEQSERISELVDQNRRATERAVQSESVIESITAGLSTTSGTIQSAIDLVRLIREQLQNYHTSERDP